MVLTLVPITFIGLYFLPPPARVFPMATYHREPYKHLKCDCGAEISVEYPENGHGYDCHGCGAIYNGGGQRLAPRSQWEDRYDDESPGRYCDEFGYSDW